jgi:hypothetical protein
VLDHFSPLLSAFPTCPSANLILIRFLSTSDKAKNAGVPVRPPWFEDVEDGWIVALNVRDFVQVEWHKYHFDYYINFGGTLQLDNWRTQKPHRLSEEVNQLIIRILS